MKKIPIIQPYDDMVQGFEIMLPLLGVTIGFRLISNCSKESTSSIFGRGSSSCSADNKSDEVVSSFARQHNKHIILQSFEMLEETIH